MMIHKSRIILTVLGALVLLTYALGALPASGASGPNQVVNLAQIEFHPHNIKAEAGNTIKFVNRDPFEHNVYIVRAANPNIIVFPATSLMPGKSVTVTIQQKGLYTVYCTIHGGMTALLSTSGSFELTEAEKQEAAKVAASLPPIVKTGEKLFWGIAQCHQCHKMGTRGNGERGPNLQDVGLRAGIQAKKLGLDSGTGYLIQSILEPSAYLVAGYTNDMAHVFQPPINLNAEQIKAVVTYLQSQGGKVDTWAINLDKNKLTSLPSMNPFSKGNPERGKQMFNDAGCSSCHRVGKKGGGLGPDLTAIGAYRNWTWLAESVIEPSAEIGSNWKVATVYPKSGQLVSGIVRGNNEKEVTLMVDRDIFKTFPLAQVKKVEISTISRMPADYGELLTFVQMADLISYLQTLKGQGG